MNDLLIDLLNEKINTLEPTQKLNEMIEKIGELGNFVLLEEESIKKTEGVIKKAKPKIQKNIILTVQNSILKNAVRLYDKLIDIINVFVNKDIYSRDVKRDMRYKSEESKPEFEESITKEQKWEDKKLF